VRHSTAAGLYLLLAQADMHRAHECPLSGVERTWLERQEDLLQNEANFSH
jgi:hypothetical protein